jgi:hypothetical protein
MAASSFLSAAPLLFRFASCLLGFPGLRLKLPGPLPCLICDRITGVTSREVAQGLDVAGLAQIFPLTLAF